MTINKHPNFTVKGGNKEMEIEETHLLGMQAGFTMVSFVPRPHPLRERGSGDFAQKSRSFTRRTSGSVRFQEVS